MSLPYIEHALKCGLHIFCRWVLQQRVCLSPTPFSDYPSHLPYIEHALKCGLHTARMSLTCPYPT